MNDDLTAVGNSLISGIADRALTPALAAAETVNPNGGEEFTARLC